MDNVLLASELVYFENLTVDIYYPPNYNFEAKLPIVILSHGFQEGPAEADKDIVSHMDWAKLIAASGMIAISAQAGLSPLHNSYHVLEFLTANADKLGVDLTRIGYWACSGQGDPVFQTLKNQKLPYRDAVKAAVFLYLDFTSADPSTWPQTLSLFVVKAGSDQYISGSKMDKFVSRAISNNIPTEYMELADAPHGFDVFVDTQASKDIIQKSLEFLKNKLLE